MAAACRRKCAEEKIGPQLKLKMSRLSEKPKKKSQKQELMTFDICMCQSLGIVKVQGKGS